MDNNEHKNSTIAVIVFIALAMVTRLLGPWVFGNVWNFAPLNAIALFSGAYVLRKEIAFLIPLFFVWIGDLLVNYFHYNKVVFFYEAFYWQYGTYLLIVLIGMLVFNGKIKPAKVFIGALSASVIFFIVTNFGFWLTYTVYPKNFTGLLASYTAAIPFFKYTLISDLFYSVALFGGFEFLRYRKPQLVEVRG